MNTIPELAEALRHHINTDNDAKRLICEHVLPLVGIDGATPQELDGIIEARSEAEELLTSVKTDLEDVLANYADDGLPAGLVEELEHIIETIDQ
jgi:hypothetical protein